jgi:hypothetical protein
MRVGKLVAFVRFPGGDNNLFPIEPQLRAGGTQSIDGLLRGLWIEVKSIE